MNKLFILTFACAYGLSMYAMEDTQASKSEPDPLFVKYKQAIENRDYETFSPDKLSLKTELQTDDDLKTLTNTERAKLQALAECQRHISKKIIKVALTTNNDKITECIDAYEKSTLIMHILNSFLTGSYFSKTYLTEESKMPEREKRLSGIFKKYKSIITTRDYEKISPNIRSHETETKVRNDLQKLIPTQRIKLQQIASVRKEVYSLMLSTENSQERYEQSALTLAAALTSLMPTSPVLYNSK